MDNTTIAGVTDTTRVSFASGYYDADTIRESHLAKLTTAELLAEASKRLKIAADVGDKRNHIAWSCVEQAIYLMTRMQES